VLFGSLALKPVFVIVVVFSCLLHVSAQAETVRELTWDHLIPSSAPMDDPTKELTYDQSVMLRTITSIRAKRELGLVSDVSDEAEMGIKFEHKLKKQALDVDSLVQRYIKMQIEVKRRNDNVVQSLDGTLIRMPGYVLPLEFDGASVEEFLLVPYVGACIHVPAPPKNQMVLVRLNQSYAFKDLYEPVWITGRMKTRDAQKSLDVKDGKIDVSAGYVLDGIRIEPYED
jgi:hypothetical protein